ncbi:unnamed protein product [Mytilus edulis]|uniref:Uncharacterized protein n=1 Tax=Mytilus edulis TaxID=6550 RepID=A0A8S3Q5E2_MYTED|nr:unnamed protein product [Mytilus edulis]
MTVKECKQELQLKIAKSTSEVNRRKLFSKLCLIEQLQVSRYLPLHAAYDEYRGMLPIELHSENIIKSSAQKDFQDSIFASLPVLLGNDIAKCTETIIQYTQDLDSKHGQALRDGKSHFHDVIAKLEENILVKETKLQDKMETLHEIEKTNQQQDMSNMTNRLINIKLNERNWIRRVASAEMRKWKMHLMKQYNKGQQKAQFSKYAIRRCIDDKAYLRCGTSEGFGRPSNIPIALVDNQPHLPAYDFSEKVGYVAPGVNLIISDMNEIEHNGKTRFTVADATISVTLGLISLQSVGQTKEQSTRDVNLTWNTIQEQLPEFIHNYVGADLEDNVRKEADKTYIRNLLKSIKGQEKPNKKSMPIPLYVQMQGNLKLKIGKRIETFHPHYLDMVYLRIQKLNLSTHALLPNATVRDFQDGVNDWLKNDHSCQCTKTTVDITHICGGTRKYSPRQFVTPEPIIIPFEVNGSPWATFPDKLKINNISYELVAQIYGNGGHFCASLRHNNKWFLYDGLKEYHSAGHGLRLQGGTAKILNRYTDNTGQIKISNDPKRQ